MENRHLFGMIFVSASEMVFFCWEGSECLGWQFSMVSWMSCSRTPQTKTHPEIHGGHFHKRMTVDQEGDIENL